VQRYFLTRIDQQTATNGGAKGGASPSTPVRSDSKQKSTTPSTTATRVDDELAGLFGDTPAALSCNDCV
jgi:hypothetical protein